MAPVSQGLVAFAAESRGSSTGLVIAVMQPNGTGFRQLTGLPGDRDADPDVARYTFASDDSPSFSPDGRTIAFVRRYTEGVNSLCKINVDGSDFRVIKRDAQMGEILLVARRSHDRLLLRAGRRIHLIDADGTNERALWPRTGGPNQDAPSWSPDSSLVYYASGGFWAARADGSGSRRVAEPPRPVGWVALCPEGSPIAFAEQVMTGRDGAIWLVDPEDRTFGESRLPGAVTGTPCRGHQVVSGCARARGRDRSADRPGRDPPRAAPHACGGHGRGPIAWWVTVP